MLRMFYDIFLYLLTSSTSSMPCGTIHQKIGDCVEYKEKDVYVQDVGLRLFISIIKSLADLFCHSIEKDVTKTILLQPKEYTTQACAEQYSSPSFNVIFYYVISYNVKIFCVSRRLLLRDYTYIIASYYRSFFITERFYLLTYIT